MNVQLDFLHLIAQASVVVQIVMIILLMASVVVWFLIFSKKGQLFQARRRANDFDEAFWSQHDLQRFYQNLRERMPVNPKSLGLENIFLAGYKEYLLLTSRPQANKNDVLDAVRRNMRVAMSRQVERVDAGLPMLATIGSAAPYVGLFGTVWGIMTAFIALGSVKYATLSMVAPGIAEALIATAMGLFAAIPAVVAYNRLSVHADSLVSQYEVFAEEFISLLSREYAHKNEDTHVAQ
jgi:biopolymer transport protein TolQ